MTSHLSLIELPDEVLTKVFSYLDHKELLCASQVCTRLNDISKAPSLWQDVDVTFRSKEKLVSFCRYFCEVNYIRTLSIILHLEQLGPVSLDDEATNAVNQLFQNLKQLHCLDVSLMDLKNISLPKTLKHLSCYYSVERNDEIALIETIKRCISIKYLNLHDEGRYHGIGNELGEPTSADLAVNDLIHKFEGTLLGLYICQRYFCVPSLNNHLQLKVLGISCVYDSPHKKDLLMSISKLPCLEVLSLETWGSLDEDLTEVLGESGNRFPELRYLSISSCNKITKRTYDLLYKKVIKLRTFCLEDTTTKASDLCAYLKKCLSLQHICLNPGFYCDCDELIFVQGMRELLSERTFQRICLPFRNCISTVSDMYIKVLPDLTGKCTYECSFRYVDDNACNHCRGPKCGFWKNFPNCHTEISFIDLF